MLLQRPDVQSLDVDEWDEIVIVPMPDKYYDDDSDDDDDY